MQYKVVPFNAAISLKEGANEAASQLEELIGRVIADGWDYVRLETIPTYVAGDAGCFGFGATAASSRESAAKTSSRSS